MYDAFVIGSKCKHNHKSWVTYRQECVWGEVCISPLGTLSSSNCAIENSVFDIQKHFFLLFRMVSS